MQASSAKRRTLIMGVVSSILLASGSPDEPFVWSERLDPVVLLAQDIDAGRFRFFSICAFACQIPGVGNLNYDRCFSKTARVEGIGGASDMFHSRRDREYADSIFAFARAYNASLASALRDRGMSACEPDEDWDEAVVELSSYLRTVFPGPPIPTLAVSTTPVPLPADFVLHLHRPLSDPMEFQRGVCSIFARHEIESRITVDIEVRRGEKSDFYCEAGMAR